MADVANPTTQTLISVYCERRTGLPGKPKYPPNTRGLDGIFGRVFKKRIDRDLESPALCQAADAIAGEARAVDGDLLDGKWGIRFDDGTHFLVFGGWYEPKEQVR